MLGKKIHELASELWPINRSITGDGVRKTLLVIKNFLKYVNYIIKHNPIGEPTEWIPWYTN